MDEGVEASAWLTEVVHAVQTAKVKDAWYVAVAGERAAIVQAEAAR